MESQEAKGLRGYRVERVVERSAGGLVQSSQDPFGIWELLSQSIEFQLAAVTQQTQRPENLL